MYMYKLIILYITQCFLEVTCISWTLNESVTCFLVCHCYISCVCCYHRATKHNPCDNRNACSRVCFVFVCYEKVPRNRCRRIKRIKEEGSGCRLKNNEWIHFDRYSAWSVTETFWRPFIFSYRKFWLSVQGDVGNLAIALINGLSVTREPHYVSVQCNCSFLASTR